MEIFSFLAQILFAMSDQRKYIKNHYTEKKRKPRNKSTKLYYNLEKWINKREYRKGRYHNEYYDEVKILVVNWKMIHIMYIVSVLHEIICLIFFHNSA